MKIGIITLFHGNINWGGALQGYALKTVIEAQYPDAQVDIIRWQSNTNIVYSGTLQRALQYSPIDIIKRGYGKFFGGKKQAKSKLVNRISAFHRFSNSVSPEPTVYTDAMLSQLANDYDCLICGSDQVWNPNIARPVLFLKGVNGCRKISYAASIARNDLTPHQREVMLPLIESFDDVSVRERTAVDFLTEYIPDKKIHEVLDPSFLLQKAEWESLISAAPRHEERFAFAFFFSESLEYRKRISEFCKEKGIKLKYIPFAQQHKYLKSDLNGAGEPLWDVGPLEFLQLFRDAEYIFTDSFHGSAFSIIFEKNFCVFERDEKGKNSQNSRLYDLLWKFDLSSRLVRKDFRNIMNEPVDFISVRKKLDTYRKTSLEFLGNAVSATQVKKRDYKRVDMLPHHKCVGCMECEAVCPKNAISMICDSEGFWYPQINQAECINCGLCVKKCVGTERHIVSEKFDTYIGYHGNNEIRQKSSSGGLFGAVANAVLSKGGVVYGAAFRDDMSVAHIRIDNSEALEKLFGSKYVQSDMSGVYSLILKDLKADKEVLFSGTPCQCAAVCRFAEEKKLDKNLFIVDFICHGVPSPAVWESYVEYIGADNVKSISFRDKEKNGWHDFHFKAELKNGKKIIQSHEKDAYMRAFISNKSLRPSCYSCAFKKEGYSSDITLGDAWKIEKEQIEWADDKGTSVFISRTKKGDELLRLISDEIRYEHSSYEAWCKMNPSIVFSTKMPTSRKEFFLDFKNDSNDAFWNKYKKISSKSILRYKAKIIAKKVGLEKTLRKVK